MKILNLLLEDDNKLIVLRKSISNRTPITIQYSGPAGEVKSGTRIDIMPVVLGTNAKSGNLVIWAYVYKGVSKKGLPNWKMFRVDRIVSAKFNLGDNSFKLSSIPGYQKGKAPAMMKSLSNIEIFSPYWLEDKEKQPVQNQPSPVKQNEPIVEPSPEIGSEQPNIEPTEPDVVEKPGMSKNNFADDIFNSYKNNLKNVDGNNIMTKMDYDNAISQLYGKKENEWKNYQKLVSGNIRPGEGTRNKFNRDSKTEFDNLLKNNNITVEDLLSEIKNRFKLLIK